jgi:hypothetical protein
LPSEGEVVAHHLAEIDRLDDTLAGLPCPSASSRDLRFGRTTPCTAIRQAHEIRNA